MADVGEHSRRYVVLRHEGVEHPHFDVMIEMEEGGALATWRSEAWPIEEEAGLVKLAAHRRAYLTYEGPVSGNRGFVRQVEAGQCRVRVEPPDAWHVRGTSSQGREFILVIRSLNL